MTLEEFVGLFLAGLAFLCGIGLMIVFRDPWYDPWHMP